MKKNSKRILSIMLAFVMILTAFPMTAMAEEAWDGMATDTGWYDGNKNEFTIDSAEELAGLAKLVNDGNNFSGKTIKLGDNIDLKNQEWTPIGTDGKPFRGTFDGNNMTISNLYINKEFANNAANCCVGLFGYTSAPAVIKNTDFVNVDIQGSLYVGTVVGYGFTGSEISNCHVSGKIEIDGWWYIGGIGGNGYVSKVDNCSVKGDEDSYIKANFYDDGVGSYVGGIWGYRGEGNMTISDCKVENIAISGTDRVGGICGIAHYNNTIQSCTISGSTITTTNNVGNTGLIAGADLSKSGSIAKILDCTVTHTAATAGGETVTTKVGSCDHNGDPAEKKATVGTNVVFADSGEDRGKIISGTLEQVDDESLASSVVAVPDENGNLTVKAMTTDNAPIVVTIGSNKMPFKSLTAAIEAAKADTGNDPVTVTITKSGTYEPFTIDSKSHNGIVVEAAKGVDAVFEISAGNTMSLYDGYTTKTPGISFKNITFLSLDGTTPLKSHYFGDDGHAFAVENCKFINKGEAAGSIAVYVDFPNITIDSCEFENWETAFYTAGEGYAIDQMNVINNTYNDVNAIVNGYWQHTPEETDDCLTISGNTINPGKWGTSSIVLWDWAQYQAWLNNSTDNVTSAIKAVVQNNTVSNGELEYHKIHCDWFTPSGITLPEGAKVINHNLVQIDGEDISDVAVYDADGELVANMSSSDDKNYIYQLPEGKYTFRITQSQTGGDSIVTEQTVTVKKPDGLEKTQKFEVKPLTETAVAKVGETTYTSLANAIEAAKNGGTVEILADASIDTWNQVWNINNLTIKGNNRSITIGQVKSNINGDYLFYGAENLNVSDLTINFKTNGNGFSMVSGKLENVKMYGGSNSNSDYAVFVGTSEDPDAKVEISNCTFDNFGIAVYSQPAGADKHTSDISVNKTTFTNCGMTMCSYAQNTVFTDNIVNGGSEISFAGGAEGNDRQNSYTITGNTFQNAGKIWFSDVDLGDVTFTKNKVLGTTEVSTEQAKGETVLNVSENYWGGQAPGEGQLTPDSKDSFEGQDVYYVRDTMRPQDLNTYVPSGGGGGTVETKYDISVDSAANGTVKASASTSAKDKTVTLTVTPDEGYVLDTLTVTDKDGKNVELTKKSDTEYTFQMPESKVTVKAVFKEEAVESTLPFTDVSDADWFYPAVKYVYDNDMMDGVGGSLFAPLSQLTRGMIAQVLYNLEKAGGEFNGSFTDVAADEWYADAVNWAAECGIVNGFGDGTFGPEQNITREQMAQILMNYAKYKGYDMTAKGDVSVFTDAAEISGWAQDAVSWAVGEKLLSGKGNGILDPAGTATRAEVAQIFMNFCENIAK